MHVTRTGVLVRPNNARVLFRAFEPPSPQRALKIVARVMELPDETVEDLPEQVLSEFHGRHQRLLQFFQERYDAVRQHVLTDRPLSESRRLLVGSYFTQEYALESAALFNPSLVWHPDQSGLPPGTRRFVLSLRATGEGHVSSVGFRTGTIDGSGAIAVAKPTGFVTAPRVVASSRYDKALFLRKLAELGVVDGFADPVFGALGDGFTFRELEGAIARTSRQQPGRRRDWEPISGAIMALARANYEIECDPASDISERVIFPYSPAETNGIEDARFVCFVEDDGGVHYYATYTAFDGSVSLPQFVETDDFVSFRVSTLNGPAIANKGMALFPRRIRGAYAMLSRQDGENIHIMESDMLHFWHTKRLVLRPTEPWEFVQIGNCGAPLETPLGWLVLTHGVGPMRKYAIGAVLLDLDDPTTVLGRLREPLLAPDENERAGYVPNVVYSCGAAIHDDLLVIPYSMSDYATSFATVPLADVLAALRPA
ncbi:MAG: glycoside hydrolase family 130 protein [Planctomycetaceae bacterium]